MPGYAQQIGRRSAASYPAGALLYRSGSAIVGMVGGATGSFPVWASGTFVDSSRAMALGTTSTVAAVVENSTAAALGAQQVSGALALLGRGWETAVGSSQTVGVLFDLLPVQAATCTGNLQVKFKTSTAGAWSAAQMTLTSAGALSCTGGFSTTNVIVTSILQPQGLINFYNGSAQGTGLGTTASLTGKTVGVPVGLLHDSRTDGAGNIVAFVCYDRNAASITNAATMRLHSFGWTNDADAYTELGAMYCDGHLTAVTLQATGDVAGLASTTTLTNGTIGAGANLAVISNLPNSYSLTPTWIKIYVGATAAVVAAYLAT